MSYALDVLGRVMAGGALLAAVAVLGVGLLRLPSAQTRVRVWRATLLALLLLPLAALTVSARWSLPVPAPLHRAAVAAESPARVAVRGAAPPIDRGGRPSATTAASGPVQTATGATEPAGRSLPLAALLLWAWAVGGAVILLHFWGGLLTLPWRSRRLRDVTREVAGLLPSDARVGVRVLRGAAFRMPVCFGLWRPTIALPAGSEAWDTTTLRAVLLHELAHLERRDPWFLLLARLARAIHWMNPLVWMVERRLLRDGETTCDATVVQRGVPAGAYARVLVDLAAGCRTRSFTPALSFARAGGLTQRVADILDEPGSTMGGGRTSGGLCVLLVAGAVAGATAGGASGAEPGPASDAAQPVALRGTWVAQVRGGDSLYLELTDADDGSLSANSFAIHDLEDLDPRGARAGGAASFRLVGAPGTVAFHGAFTAAGGTGSYSFTPEPGFTAAVLATGLETLHPHRSLVLTLQGMTHAWLDGLMAGTTGPRSEDLLVRAAIFAVDPPFIREMGQLGYVDLAVQDLVRLRIFDVDGNYIRDLAGERLSVEELVSRRIQERRAEKGEARASGHPPEGRRNGERTSERLETRTSVEQYVSDRSRERRVEQGGEG
jgi:beta-lactamase regulating signal transducer with metallopeptidase domain